MNVFLLCAGEGTRMRPYTLHLPKPALPFLGVPLFEFSLAWADEVKPTRVVINTHHLAEKLKSCVLASPCSHSSVYFSDEKDKLMNSAGGLKKAETLFDSETILTMNGDEVFLPLQQNKLSDAYRYHKSQKNLMTILVCDHPDVGAKFGGIWCDQKNHVVTIAKQHPAASQFPSIVKGWHFIGAIFIEKELLSYIPDGSSHNIFYDTTLDILKGPHRQRIHAYPIEGWWHETGNPTDFINGSRDCLQFLDGNNSYPKFLTDRLLKTYRKNLADFSVNNINLQMLEPILKL